MASSKTVLQLLIDKLPGDFLQADPTLRETIAPILIELDDIRQKYYLSIIKKKLNVDAKLLSEILEVAKKEKDVKAKQEKENQEIRIDPEIEKAASDIAQDPQLFLKRIHVINQSGVVGEKKNISMFYCALDSRLLLGDAASPNALAIKCSGHFGTGKSYAIGKCLVIYPKNAYHMTTGGSAKSLYFLKDGLKHKCLIVAEGFNFQTNNAADSEFVYSIRSLISEGEVSYQITQKGEDGNYVTCEKRIAGPTSFVTTTVMENLEGQLEDRLFSIHPDESVDQTREIIMMTANQKSGNLQRLDERVIKTWMAFHASLKPVSVDIPYAPKIAEMVAGKKDTDEDKNGKLPLTSRRAFKRLMNVIQSIACAYQCQRKRGDNGEVIAEIADYHMALQIVDQAFRESMGEKNPKTKKWLEYIDKEGKVSHKSLGQNFGVASGTVTDWIKKMVKDNSIIWCDADGFQFADDNALKKAKPAGKAFLRISNVYQKMDIKKLPSPFELTGNTEWDKEGKLYQLYDLHLDKKEARDSCPQECSGVFGGVKSDLNTSNESNVIDIINDSSIDGGSVQVFSVLEEDKEKNEKAEDEDGYDEEIEEEEKALNIKEDQSPLIDKFNRQLNNITSNTTPDICRSGCIHYDPVDDVNLKELIEYCCHNNGSVKINFIRSCKYYEKHKSLLPEGVMAF